MATGWHCRRSANGNRRSISPNSCQKSTGTRPVPNLTIKQDLWSSQQLVSWSAVIANPFLTCLSDVGARVPVSQPFKNEKCIGQVLRCGCRAQWWTRYGTPLFSFQSSFVTGIFTALFMFQFNSINVSPERLCTFIPHPFKGGFSVTPSPMAMWHARRCKALWVSKVAKNRFGGHNPALS